MQFHPNYPIDNNKGQHHVWRRLKNLFRQDEGIAYYRYPIFATIGRARREPDFLIVHRRYGVWVLESKGCLIGNIAAIEGHDWLMRDWYSETMSPVSQVEDQMFEVKTLVERDRELRRLGICFEYRVVLPFVRSAEWSNSGYADHPSTQGVVWCEEDLEARTLRRHLKEATQRYMPALSDAQWARLCAAFRGSPDGPEPRPVVAGAPRTHPSRIVHAVESRLKVLDEQQDRIAQEVPEGPQRIRGLAGTGKTILFARRAAQMHVAYPEWNVAFVYWSRSLNDTMKTLVEQACRRFTGEPPDWNRLHVWHAWGSRERTGFYREAASRWGCRFLSLKRARALARHGEAPFEAAMRLLEQASEDAEPFLDAVLIDEGQDLPAAFYRVAYRALKPPKRLYWAYDEAQGIDSLIVPRASEVFGRDEEGRPKVDLSGYYPSGILKAHNMNRCYRTPRIILTAAHAINMGLLREGGPLQGVTQQNDWASLGYEVIEGDFTAASVKAGKTVTIQRTAAASGHPVDAPDFGVPFEPEQVLRIHLSESEADDIQQVVTGIERDLENGLRPEDIAVVCLGTGYRVLRRISERLGQLGIGAVVLDREHRDRFRHEGKVTLTGVRRAKGNEAYKIYALDLHQAGGAYARSIEAEMIARNQAFVALTRAKLWCEVIGREGEILQELQQACERSGRLVFPAFNQNSLKRSMVEEEGQMEMPLG